MSSVKVSVHDLSILPKGMNNLSVMSDFSIYHVTAHKFKDVQFSQSTVCLYHNDLPVICFLSASTELTATKIDIHSFQSGREINGVNVFVSVHDASASIEQGTKTVKTAKKKTPKPSIADEATPDLRKVSQFAAGETSVGPSAFDENGCLYAGAGEPDDRIDFKSKEVVDKVKGKMAKAIKLPVIRKPLPHAKFFKIGDVIPPEIVDLTKSSTDEIKKYIAELSDFDIDIGFSITVKPLVGTLVLLSKDDGWTRAVTGNPYCATRANSKPSHLNTIGSALVESVQRSVKNVMIEGLVIYGRTKGEPDGFIVLCSTEKIRLPNGFEILCGYNADSLEVITIRYKLGILNSTSKFSATWSVSPKTEKQVKPSGIAVELTKASRNEPNIAVELTKASKNEPASAIETTEFSAFGYTTVDSVKIDSSSTLVNELD